jgi:hypothetical protein
MRPSDGYNKLSRQRLPFKVTANLFLTFEKTPRVDVMITIFSDFCQFSAKKLAFFSKTNVMITILHNLALF